MNIRRADLALVLAIGLILVATLPGVRGQTLGRFQMCVVCGEAGSADAVLNVLLFLPFGAALAWGRRGIGTALIAGACLSLGIEIAQLALPGRYSTLGDVVWNTTGAGLGAWLFACVRGGMLRRGYSWRRMAGMTLLVTATWIGAALLFLPDLPDVDYYGQWTADMGYLEHYDGQVLSANIATMPLPSHRLKFPGAVRLALLAGQPLTVRVRAGQPTSALAPVFSMFFFTGKWQELAILGVAGNDLVWRTRTFATALRLRPVQARWRGAFRGVLPGDTITLRARVAGAADVCLWMNARSWCGGPGLARGWSLFLDPSWIPAWLRPVADIAWIAAFTLLALWWAPGRVGVSLGGLTLAVCLVAVASGLGVSVGWTTFVGWATGVSGGLVASGLCRDPAVSDPASPGPTTRTARYL